MIHKYQLKEPQFFYHKKKEVSTVCMVFALNQVVYSGQFKKNKLPVITIFVSDFGLIV